MLLSLSYGNVHHKYINTQVTHLKHSKQSLSKDHSHRYEMYVCMMYSVGVYIKFSYYHVYSTFEMHYLS